ncbi:Kazal-type serine protease inhibitor domain [Popillia japonica]|uniref:Kazal-type serine protease inhibitor domain n=1 Tax=Popillia japonica TaxID=7064 RepID=A0AAW1J0G2_POPJA
MKNIGILFFVLAIVLCTTNAHLAHHCPKICTLEYNPICGEDSNGNRQTYGNRCDFDSTICQHPRRGIRFIKQGEC